MAAFELLLSHARRQSLLLLRSTSSSSLHSSQSRHLTSSSPLLGFQRLFSTSDSPSEDQEQPKPPLIKTVSYPVKPKDPETSTKPEHQPEFRRPREERRPRENTRDNNMNMRQESQEAETQTETNAEPPRSSWSREDARYMKDVPIITPVSYPIKVAPLPEDDVAVKKEQEEEESRRENEQLEKEKRRIEMDARLKRSLRLEEEKSLPFPSLIKVEKKKSKVPFDLQDALREVKANAKCDFVETVEAHVGLTVDPRRGDQMVRGAATLPHGTGKVVRVAVFAEGEVAEVARAAGADVVGADELIEEIRKGGGKLNFDKCISTPLFMPRLGKIARILGPRGLMPNPKLGSVTSDVAGAVREAKRGRIDFKIDKTAIVHVGLGKVNFSEEALRENICAFVHALLVAKPAGLKKTSKYAGYVKSFSLASSMGPGFPVSLQSLTKAAEDYIKLQVK